MSEFIKHVFSEQGGRRFVREKMPDISNLDMSCVGIEMMDIPKQVISFTFKALWQMKTSGTAEEYDELHKIAIGALKRAVYDGFYTKLTHLELALYDYDVEKAKKIIRGIKEEVGL